MKLQDVSTPRLLLDRTRLRNNIRTMAQRMDGLGGVLRPHVKTHKSFGVLEEVMKHGTVKGITVSTLKEAAYFFEKGVTDILYAIGMTAPKFDDAAALIQAGCTLTMVLDSTDIATAAVQAGDRLQTMLPFLIEIDVDQHRAGVQPESGTLLDIAQILEGGAFTSLKGVMTHAGESYACTTHDELLTAARNERDKTVMAANRLRQAGYNCADVSIGSTPTICTIDDLTGVTEVRPGVYTFFDLVMAGIGVCSIDNIAIGVLATVIGHQKERGWVLTDAGWMAMSRDLGTASQADDYGYGLVCDLDGNPIPDIHFARANQEHGIITGANGKPPPFERLSIGTQVRILPNHACATAAQYPAYDVVDAGQIIDRWDRAYGW